MRRAAGSEEFGRGPKLTTSEVTCKVLLGASRTRRAELAKFGFVKRRDTATGLWIITEHIFPIA